MKKPTGFIATCQCGLVTGALDAERTNRQEAGKILGRWLAQGCTVEPQFDSSWSVRVQVCQCDTSTGNLYRMPPHIEKRHALINKINWWMPAGGIPPELRELLMECRSEIRVMQEEINKLEVLNNTLVDAKEGKQNDD